MRRLICVVACLGLATQAASAQVFRCLDEKGGITFSDRHCPRGTKPLPRSAPLPARTEPTGKKWDAAPAREDAPAKPTPASGRAVVTLARGGTVLLETRTMKSGRGMSWYLGNGLALPSGVVVSYRDIQRIAVGRSAEGSAISIEITLRDGKRRTEVIERPFVRISGDADVGRFARSLEEIASVSFY